MSTTLIEEEGEPGERLWIDFSKLLGQIARNPELLNREQRENIKADCQNLLEILEEEKDAEET